VLTGSNDENREQRDRLRADQRPLICTAPLND
jgi:hypothetical protein